MTPERPASRAKQRLRPSFRRGSDLRQRPAADKAAGAPQRAEQAVPEP